MREVVAGQRPRQTRRTVIRRLIPELLTDEDLDPSSASCLAARTTLCSVACPRRDFGHLRSPRGQSLEALDERRWFLFHVLDRLWFEGHGISTANFSSWTIWRQLVNRHDELAEDTWDLHLWQPWVPLDGTQCWSTCSASGRGSERLASEQRTGFPEDTLRRLLAICVPQDPRAGEPNGSCSMRSQRLTPWEVTQEWSAVLSARRRVLGHAGCADRSKLARSECCPVSGVRISYAAHVLPSPAKWVGKSPRVPARWAIALCSASRSGASRPRCASGDPC